MREMLSSQTKRLFCFLLLSFLCVGCQGQNHPKPKSDGLSRYTVDKVSLGESMTSVKERLGEPTRSDPDNKNLPDTVHFWGPTRVHFSSKDETVIVVSGNQILDNGRPLLRIGDSRAESKRKMVSMPFSSEHPDAPIWSYEEGEIGITLSFSGEECVGISLSNESAEDLK